jgi:hypothetical protein
MPMHHYICMQTDEISQEDISVPRMANSVGMAGSDGTEIALFPWRGPEGPRKMYPMGKQAEEVRYG